MNVELFFKFLHVIGISLGAGGAFVQNIFFTRNFSQRTFTKDQSRQFETFNSVSWLGLIALVISGAGMLNTGKMAMLSLSLFQVKLGIVGILLISGIALRPILGRALYKLVDTNVEEAPSKRLALISVIMGLTTASWVSIIFLGVFRYAEFPIMLTINGYLLFLTAYIVGQYEILVAIVNKKIKRTLALLTGIVFIILAVGGVRWWIGQSKIHEICINEQAPWFEQNSIKINNGDTVVWRHCVNKINTHVTQVHTHPLFTIEGPEKFSTHLRPVGYNVGETFSYTFTKEGNYTYICPTHPYMKGAIAVGKNTQLQEIPWPPEEIIKPSLLPVPITPGVGEIWIDTQFEQVPGQDFPGSITVVDAVTWKEKAVIKHPDFNNPHNIWPNGDKDFLFQTQWHSDTISKINAQTKEVLKTVHLGNAPAHVFRHPKKDRVYVSINNENRIVILNENLEKIGEIPVSQGPHGIWIDPSGKWMTVAATLSGKLDIIELDQEKVVATIDAPGLPLASSITNDGKYALISLLTEGSVRIVDLVTKQIVKDIPVGKSPIWPAPAPDGKIILVPNTTSADISVISLDTLDVIRTIPATNGTHGIIYGKKEGGGYYGYVSSKFTPMLEVIDMQTLEIAGYVRLHDGALGGTGIIALPNAYDELVDRD